MKKAMTIFFSAIIVFMILLQIPFPRTEAYAQAVYDRNVVVIAIDGLKADIFRRYAFNAEGNPPSNSFFRELSRPNGQYQNHLSVKLTRAVFPTYTFAAWASVFTGTYPGKHGIQGQNFYIRNLDEIRRYDYAPSGWDAVYDLLSCDIPNSVQIYGWDIDCNELISAVTTMGLSLGAGLLTGDPYDLYRVIKTSISLNDLIEKLANPCIDVWIPGIVVPIPLNFCLVDFYQSGGIQNGDLLKQTLYDYAQSLDYKTYAIHNFYNRSNLNLAGNRISWDNVYGSGLKGIDESWGRPTYNQVRNAVVVPSTDDYEILDKAVIPKAKKYISKNGPPHILTLYFAVIDGESHHYTDPQFMHSSLNQAQFVNLRKIDLWLIDFVKFLKSKPEYDYDQTVFLLISDHGHSEGKRNFDLSILPQDKYRVLKNGYMVHIYIKNSQTGDWTQPPSQTDFDEFMNKVLPDPKYKMWNDFEVVLGRAPNDGVYKAYHRQGNSYKAVSIDKLEDIEYMDPHDVYSDPVTQIAGVNNLNRSGDIILLPADSIGHTVSTHGSLRESDTDVPFYIFGEPVKRADHFRKGSGPRVLCGASLVDVTPTILNVFNIYSKFKGNLDGRPLLNKDLAINFEDFTRCRGSGASDFLYGRWKNFEGEVTKIILHNPSSVSRDAAVLYYGWREDFKGCQTVRLSPHDQVELKPPIKGGGPVEIRAAPLQKEKRPGGLVGYIVRQSGETTLSAVQLILDDETLFNIDRKNQSAIYNCTCDKLLLMKSPLVKLFCPKSK